MRLVSSLLRGDYDVDINSSTIVLVIAYINIQPAIGHVVSSQLVS